MSLLANLSPGRGISDKQLLLVRAPYLILYFPVSIAVVVEKNKKKN